VIIIVASTTLNIINGYISSVILFTVLESSISASDQNTDLIRQLVVQLLRQRTGQTGLNQQTPQPQFNQLSQQTSFNQFDLQTPQGPPGVL